ncbi:hypothetical protein CH305_18470 [Rhodococcus sp. 15-649-2-2]|nr:hypothetical protein CH305_18470 [Rhodococcus sp. 15-649-2-2]
MRFVERWVLLRDNPGVPDESTGVLKPVPPTEIPYAGLLQQRQLSSSSVDAGNTELYPGNVVSSFVLLLEPAPLDGSVLDPPRAKDRLRGPDGLVVHVVGLTRPRRNRNHQPRYIAAIVRASSDMKE